MQTETRPIGHRTGSTRPGRFPGRIRTTAPTRPPAATVRLVQTTADVHSIQRLRHALLGSFAGAIAGFQEQSDRLIEKSDLTGTHVGAFDHDGRTLMAVRLDECDVSRSASPIPISVRRELVMAGVDLDDGRTRCLSDRLHVTSGAGGHLTIRLLAKMLEIARGRGWVGDLCHCDPEHFEIRRTLGYRPLGVFAASLDGRSPMRELMYLPFPDSKRRMG